MKHHSQHTSPPAPGKTARGADSRVASSRRGVARGLGLVLLATAATAAAQTPVTPPVVVCMGDSITAGTQNSFDYPSRLAEFVNGPVVNAGVGGKVASFGVAVVDGLLLTHRPSHVLILYGTNDVNVGLNPDTTTAQLMEMARRAHARGAMPILGTIPPFSGPKSSLRSASLALNDRIRSEAQYRGYAVADLGALFAVRTDLMQGDGFHVTDTGLLYIRDLFLEAMQNTPAYFWLSVGAHHLGGGWCHSPWFRYFYIGSAPWIYHPELGWMYLFGNQRSGFWWYDASAGFQFTGETLFPYLWSVDEGAWLYYFRGSGNGATGLFVNLSTGEYLRR
jgi:lysophospholipase L1-like esterase